MTPAQLVKAVSLALDVPEETVATHDRNLVTATLRTTGARGVNAPAMTPLDAARLMVAILGSVRVKDSVEAVRAFERTRHTLEPWSLAVALKKIVTEGGERLRAAYEAELGRQVKRMKDEIIRTEETAQTRADFAVVDEAKALVLKFEEYRGEFPPDDTVTALPVGHSFVQALEALITSASAPFDNLDDYLQRYAHMAIQCRVPTIRGCISRVGPEGESIYVIPTPKEPKDILRRVGIAQDRTATGTAIMLLGKAFRDNGLPFATTEKALDALLGSKKAPAKAKNKVR